MSETQHASFTFADFRLQNGEVMPEVTIAYCTRGRLAADGRNAVLVTHGYTSGHRMIESGAGSSEGSWSTLVGPGAPIDTDRCFVVCSNMLGSSYGSTNAATRDPRTGRPYGSRFPNITVADIVDRAAPAAAPSRREAYARGGGAIVWGVSGIPVGGDVSRRHGRRCPGGVFAARAEPRSRGDASGSVRAEPELARRRLLRHAGHVRQPVGTAGGDAEALWHERVRGGDHAAGVGVGEGVRCELAADPGSGDGGIRRDVGTASYQRPGAVCAVAHGRAVSAGSGAWCHGQPARCRR